LVSKDLQSIEEICPAIALFLALCFEQFVGGAC